MKIVEDTISQSLREVRKQIVVAAESLFKNELDPMVEQLCYGNAIFASNAINKMLKEQQPIQEDVTDLINAMLFLQSNALMLDSANENGHMQHIFNTLKLSVRANLLNLITSF